jgi:hypothetical protein
MVAANWRQRKEMKEEKQIEQGICVLMSRRRRTMMEAMERIWYSRWQ